MPRVDRYGEHHDYEPEWFRDWKLAIRDKKRLAVFCEALYVRLPNATRIQLEQVASMAEPRTPGPLGELADRARYYLERQTHD